MPTPQHKAPAGGGPEARLATHFPRGYTRYPMENFPLPGRQGTRVRIRDLSRRVHIPGGR